MINAKHISEIPETILRTLYGLRLYEDLEIPYEEYVKRYKLVTIGHTAYYSSECETWRLNQWILTCKSSSRKMTLPDAVIDGWYVTKNRFGHNSFL